MKNFALLDVFYQTKKSGMVKNLAYFRLKILCSTFYLIRLGLVCEFCNFLHVGFCTFEPCCAFSEKGGREGRSDRAVPGPAGQLPVRPIRSQEKEYLKKICENVKN